MVLTSANRPNDCGLTYIWTVETVNGRQKMKRKCVALFCVLTLLLCFVGCDFQQGVVEDPFDIMGEDPYNIRNEGGFNVFVSKKVARKVLDNGWVFTFIHNIDKTGDESDILKYQFFGINIRYRFDESFSQILTHTKDDGTVIKEKYTPAIMIWGTGSDAQKRDMDLVSDLLSNDKSADDLLSINPEDYKFEELDGDIFFELLTTALSSAPQAEGTVFSYWEKPTYAFLSEQIFIDDYKFQVAFLQETGCVDELYIDVLFKTGDRFDDYVQLSDLVQSGEATEMQKELFILLNSITQDVKNEESFLARSDSYANTVIDGVDLSRLYTFMKNIHENNFTPYREDPIVETIEVSQPL